MLSNYLPPVYFPFGEEDERLKKIYTCAECGDDIMEGNSVWIVGDKPYCEGCITAAHGTAEREV